MSDEPDNPDDKKEKDYAVGYGKPPERTRFQKGSSGNPRGRPKGSRAFKSILLDAMRAPVTVKENGRTRRISKAEASAKSIANKAAMGDLRSAKFFVDQTSELEQKEAEVVVAQSGESARDSLKRKLDALAARMRAAQGLPPEDDPEQGTPTV